MAYWYRCPDCSEECEGKDCPFKAGRVIAMQTVKQAIVA